MSFTTAPQDHPRAAPIETATGVPLATWAARLDEAGARDLDHAATARALVDRWDISEWWAQGVTVAYEQLIGRRVVGQSCEGDFSASASRTVPGDMDAVRTAWDAFLTPRRREELGITAVRRSDTATWRYWRADLDDGTRVSVNITAKDGTGASARSTLGLEHRRIETADAREVWKAAWKRLLADFSTTLEENR